MNKYFVPVAAHALFITFALTVLFFGFWECLFLKLTGLPCPTCGVLRALKSLLIGDIYGYFEYNFFAIPLVFTFLAAVHYGKFRKKKILRLLIVLTATANFVFYSTRIFVAFDIW